MSRIIEVDWAELKGIANKFLENSTELDKTANEFSEILEVIRTQWQGVDSDNFIKNCQDMITTINEESSYLKIWNDFLSKSSGKYDDNVETIIMKLQNMNSDLESVE